MDLAALAALRQPVPLDLCGFTCQVPPRAVGVWAASLSEPVPLLAVLDLADAIALNSLRYESDSPVDEDLCEQAWRSVLAAQSGLPAHVAERLLVSCIAQWHDVAGTLALSGQDALTQPIDLLLAAVWALARKNVADEKELAALTRQVWGPDPAEQAPAEAAPVGWTAEDEGAAWLAASRSAATRTAQGTR